MSVLEIAAVLLLSTSLAVLALLAVVRFTRSNGSGLAVRDAPVAFLFEDEIAIHATPLAQGLLDPTAEDTRWADLRDALAARFPALPLTPPDAGNGTLDIASVDPEDRSTLRIEPFGQHTRVELIEGDTDPSQSDRHIARKMRVLHDALDEACQTAPFLMWRVDESNRVTWSNSAYDELAQRVNPEAASKDLPVMSMPFQVSERRKARLPVELAEDGGAAWYEATATPVDHGTMLHATSIDAVIQAEIAQRNFVQTLAKTFAQLSIGLAIFDRNRQLVLFNPALVDLTDLQVEFLSARPELLTFFDNLRDRRIMPEPKNYASWRKDISNMVAAAKDGDFQETWNLHGGKTYRVTGRPHPDGALAFLIEDISEEISKTRTIRAEVALGHRVLDCFDDAIVVFSQSGALSYCNAAYRKLWQHDPDTSFAETTTVDCIRTWESACNDNADFARVESFAKMLGDRAGWSCDVTLKSGAKHNMEVLPIASGETMVRFKAPIPADSVG